jgi:prepilin-type N-terminal cleavage/methylation domain-containing protein
VAGFTLLELIVVMTVLATVVAIAAPTLPAARSEADTLARDVVRVLDRARFAAAERGAPTFVTLDLDSGTYEVWIGLAATTNNARAASDSLVATGSLGGRSTVGRHTISFDPFGRAAGGPVRLFVGGPVIEVEPWTGKAHVTR